VAIQKPSHSKRNWQLNIFAEKFGNFHEDEIVSINDSGERIDLFLARKMASEDESEPRVILETCLTCEEVSRKTLRSGANTLQWELLKEIDWLDVIHLAVEEEAKLALHCEGQLATLPYQSYVIEIEAVRVKVTNSDQSGRTKR
jgi:hypothetical protein